MRSFCGCSKKCSWVVIEPKSFREIGKHKARRANKTGGIDKSGETARLFVFLQWWVGFTVNQTASLTQNNSLGPYMSDIPEIAILRANRMWLAM